MTKFSDDNSVIGRKFDVLDHGHIVLMDHMGDDAAIVQAARTCYQKGTKKVNDDRNLIRYLMRNRHSSPFESCVAKFHVKLPIFVERQWARHRTAGWNEVSARYSELPEEYYIPRTEDVCAQSKINKQGRDEPIESASADAFRAHSKDVARYAFDVYHTSLECDIARELARISLPLGTYTEKVWWINLKNLLDFLSLRMDSHAQWEIRQYANIIGHQIVATLFPLVWEAFVDYRLDAMTLSGPEVKHLYSRLTGNAVCTTALGDREQKEFKAKLERLGIG
jgi:thymidylate synthase (FAD)